MRFLLDDSADGRLLPILRANGHDAVLVAHEYGPAVTDEAILVHAIRESRVIITCDRDFGELVVRLHRPHSGVILYRLSDRSLSFVEERILLVLEHYTDQLDQFMIITDHNVRVRR